MVVNRMPAVLRHRDRDVDRFREVIERYDVSSLTPTEPLPNRSRVIERDVRHLRATAGEQTGSLSVVARSRLVHAEDRRRLASSRVRELVRNERTLLRFVLLRHLVRTPYRP
jgi:hypothetical protein